MSEAKVFHSCSTKQKKILPLGWIEKMRDHNIILTRIAYMMKNNIKMSSEQKFIIMK
jgi:hypothetical protein